MIPGQYVTVLSADPGGWWLGQSKGLELRDTLQIMLPGPSSLLCFLFRVPLGESTVCGQVLKTGTGAINIDACRVAHQSEADRASATPQGAATSRSGRLAGKSQGGGERTPYEHKQGAGRWPSNLLLVHHPECLELGTQKIRGANVPGRVQGSKTVRTAYGTMGGHRPTTYADPDGLETVAAWQCHPTCPCGLLDRQSGVSLSTGGRNRNITPSAVYGAGKGLGSSSAHVTVEEARGDPGFGDTGGASRFYPGFTSLAECLVWVDRLINGPGPV